MISASYLPFKHDSEVLNSEILLRCGLHFHQTFFKHRNISRWVMPSLYTCTCFTGRCLIDATRGIQINPSWPHRALAEILGLVCVRAKECTSEKPPSIPDFVLTLLYIQQVRYRRQQVCVSRQQATERCSADIIVTAERNSTVQCFKGHRRRCDGESVRFRGKCCS